MEKKAILPYSRGERRPNSTKQGRTTLEMISRGPCNAHSLYVREFNFCLMDYCVFLRRSFRGARQIVYRVVDGLTLAVNIKKSCE